jgi:hypothetical protein
MSQKSDFFWLISFYIHIIHKCLLPLQPKKGWKLEAGHCIFIFLFFGFAACAE